MRSRLVVAALVAVPSAVVLSGCGAGFHAESSLVKPDYAATGVGDLRAEALVLVKSADNRSVALAATIVNDGTMADVLDRVTVQPGQGNEAARPGAALTAEPSLSIPPGAVVRVGGPGRPRVDLPDPERRLRVGSFAATTFSFQRAGMAQVGVLVENPEGYLAPYGPGPTTAGPTATAGP